MHPTFATTILLAFTLTCAFAFSVDPAPVVALIAAPGPRRAAGYAVAVCTTAALVLAPGLAAATPGVGSAHAPTGTAVSGPPRAEPSATVSPAPEPPPGSGHNQGDAAFPWGWLTVGLVVAAGVFAVRSSRSRGGR